MEFENRGELTFWQLACIAGLRAGQRSVVAIGDADRATQAQRERSAEVVAKEEAALKALDKVIDGLKEKADKQSPPQDILQLLPRKPDTDDSSN